MPTAATHTACVALSPAGYVLCLQPLEFNLVCNTASDHRGQMRIDDGGHTQGIDDGAQARG